VIYGLLDYHVDYTRTIHRRDIGHGLDLQSEVCCGEQEEGGDECPEWCVGVPLRTNIREYQEPESQKDDEHPDFQV